MFEKIGRLADRAANEVGVSRRGFLGRVGQTALGAAGVLGGLLALSNKAQAGNGVLYLCQYGGESSKKCYYNGGSYVTYSCGGCPLVYCYKLISKSVAGTC